MNTEHLIQLIILIILIMLSAFFSSAETALTTVSKIRIRNLIEENNKRALTLQKVVDQYGKMLSTILIGNNIVNIAASAITTTLAISIWGNVAVGIATGVLTIVILIMGEIVPKTWATTKTELIALIYSPIIYALMKILTPVIFLVDKLANAFFHLMHIDRNASDTLITESELKTIVDVSHEDGVIESEEREMIYNVFDFSDANAKDIMIPRVDMTAVNVSATYEELLSIFRDSMYTRVPVFEDDPDHIIGIVNIKDLLFIEDISVFQISSILRKTYYTYEFKKTSDLLFEMRESSTTMAIVLNEYGVAVGLITLEDLLEEIVGEIRDEYDEDENEFIKELSDAEFLIMGSIKLDDINDALSTDFDSEDYDSIGGIIIEALDRFPEKGEEVTLDNGILLRVEDISQNRIEKVYLKLPPAESAGEEEDTSTDTTGIQSEGA